MSARTLIALVVAVAALLPAPLPASAAATTRHVAPGGSDSASGTASAPWATLQHAVDNVGPGDTIVVRPGTYAGMRVEVSGTASAPITIRSARRGTAVIDRPGPRNRHESNVEFETWDGPGTVSHWSMDGFEVRNAPGWGIDVRGRPGAHSHHITIRRNEVHLNGVRSGKTGIFFAFTDDVRVVGNDSHHNGEHGVYLSNSGDRFVIRGNDLHHNRNCGAHFNGDLSQGGDGVISDGRVDANLITENGTGGCAGINLDGVTDAVIANNVIVENHATGIAVFQQDGAVCSRRIRIINNTVVQAADGRWAIVVAGCPAVTLRNNVLLTRHPWRGVVEMPDGVPSLFRSDHNLVTPRFTLDGGNTVIGLGAWRAATGGDASTTASDPTAVFAPGSYRHRTPGPAEDAGMRVPNRRDHDGVRRPSGGSWDIGAFETPLCGTRKATIVGTPGADRLRGTPGPDVIVGLSGPDTISAARGNDVICGGRGRDRIAGGPGDDVLEGGQGSDAIRGGRGFDMCRTGEDLAGCEA